MRPLYSSVVYRGPPTPHANRQRQARRIARRRPLRRARVSKRPFESRHTRRLQSAGHFPPPLPVGVVSCARVSSVLGPSSSSFGRSVHPRPGATIREIPPIFRRDTCARGRPIVISDPVVVSVVSLSSLVHGSSSSIYRPDIRRIRRQAVVVQERLVGGRRRREQHRKWQLSAQRVPSRWRWRRQNVPARGPVEVGHVRKVRGRQAEEEEKVVGHRLVVFLQQRVASVHTQHHQAVHAQQRPVAVM